MLEAYLEVLDLGYFEVGEAFQGLADEHVWMRPAAGLVSVGELAGHVAYWEALRLACQGAADPPPDLSQVAVSSPLIDHRFRYLPTILASAPSNEQLQMTAQQTHAELLRVHRESVARFRVVSPVLDATPPGWTPPWTYREFLKYAAFHVSYHTGQIYTARHLLGETPPDN